ncbi:hypothetical protein EON83_17290 [bacterium]|nr:MAG: hypothetical protein EON83_17290 [bacterium]
MNRKREQAELIYLLGRLLGPLEQASANPELYDADEKERIKARLMAEFGPFFRKVADFCKGEPGHLYGKQENSVANMYSWTLERARVEKFEDLKTILQSTKFEIIQEILSIPVATDSAIYEATSPFSTYCLVKDICTTVRSRIVWLDRYFDQTIFHRFFIDTPPNVEIVLVTQPSSNLRGNADNNRHSAFMDISKLFAQERGPNGYRLVENASFHDRWLQCDSKLLVLGGSIKDLNKGPFTVSRLDSTPANQQHFDDAISQGTEIFGPNQTTHP